MHYEAAFICEVHPCQILLHRHVLGLLKERSVDLPLSSCTHLNSLLSPHSQFLMPGLVDTHIHAPQYMFTGTGYDQQLLEWLEKYTFPTEAKFKSVEVAKHVYPLVVVGNAYVTVLVWFR